jgi:hypothetical protein
VSAGTLRTVLANDKPYYLRGIGAFYRGFNGNNEEFKNRSSGAYILRPEFQAPVRLRILNNTVHNGDVFMESRVTLSSEDNKTLSFYFCSLTAHFGKTCVSEEYLRCPCFPYGCLYVCTYGFVRCRGQNKRIAPLPFFHGCRKRRLK